MEDSEGNEFVSKRVRPIVTRDSSIEANRVTDLEVKTWVDNFGSDVDKGSPPVQIVRNLEHLDKTWGWNRLVPMGSRNEMDFYWKYLEIYHSRNTHESVAEEQNLQQCPLDNVVQANKISTNGSGCRNDLAAMIRFCLEMDDKLMGMWKIRPKHRRLASTFLLSHMIQERASQVMSTNVEFSDVAVAAFMCIGNEAGLMCEMLKLDAAPNDINRSDRIRMFALNLINYKPSGSVTAAAAAAAMVGMAKEAKLMSEWMSNEKKLIVSHDPLVPREILECHVIREATFHLMVIIVQHYVRSAPIATPIILDATAAAEPSKSSGGSTDKLNCEDHQGQKQDEMRNAQKRKYSEVSIGVALPTEEGVMKNSDEANRIVDDDKKWLEMWAKNYYVDDHRPPPVQIVKYEDLLEKTWGWKRLVPLPSLVEKPFYWDYLVKYYQRNALNDVGAEKTIQDWLLKPGADQFATNGSGCGNHLFAAAKCCIAIEDELMSALHTQSEHMPSTIVLSHMIKERARLLVSRKDDFSEVAMAAFVCIGKEAKLMCEMLKLNAGPRDIGLSDLIRMCALSFMNYRGRTSTAAAGAMVGIAHEANVMCDWLREDNELIAYRDPSLPQYIFHSKIIRETAFDLMVSIVEDYSSCEIARDGNGAGNAVAEEAKSMWANPDKLKCEDHKTKKRKRNKKNNKKRIPKFQNQTWFPKNLRKMPSRPTLRKASSMKRSLRGTLESDGLMQQ